jgi:hypothetical protein
LEKALERLTDLPKAEQSRGILLLNYLGALVYNYRSPAENEELGEKIESTKLPDALKREARAMIRTMADVHRDEGRQEGRQEGELLSKQSLLIHLLEKRFKAVPTDVVSRVRSESDTNRIDEWFDKAISADQLSDVGIV